MVEYGVELVDKKPTYGLAGMDRIVINIQGNKISIEELLIYLAEQYEISKCHERKCNWMQKTKEEMKE